MSDDYLWDKSGTPDPDVRHLEEVLGTGHVVPAVNQFELHPFLYPREVIALCDRATVR